MIENYAGQGALQLKGDGAVLGALQWFLSSSVLCGFLHCPNIWRRKLKKNFYNGY
jgi:hypothetical protein